MKLVAVILTLNEAQHLPRCLASLAGVADAVLVADSFSTDDPRQRRPDITLAKEKLGWEPTIHLEEGLIHTIAYFDDLLQRGMA